MRATISFSGFFTPVLSARSEKSLKLPFFLSSRMAIMDFFPSPGSSSSMCLRMLMPSASLKKRMNLSCLDITMSVTAYSNSAWALLVRSL